MSNETLEVTVKFNAGGDAKQKIDDLAAGTKKLETAEEKYQAKILARLRAQNEAQRMQEDMVKMGISPRALSDEERYQKLFAKRLDQLREAKRLNDDLVKAGARAGPQAPLTSEQRYQQDFTRRVDGMKTKERMDKDLIAAGLKADPAVAKQEAETRQQHAKAEEARRRSGEYSDQKQMKTFLSMIAGRPVEAGMSAMIGSGAGHAAKLNIAMAVAAAVPLAMSKVTELSNIQQNSSMTGVQKDRAIGRSMGLGFLIDFADAVDGTTERMRKLNEIINPQLMIQAAGETEKIRSRHPMEMEQFKAGTAAGLQNRYVSAGSGAAFTWQSHDRMTMQSEREYEVQERMKPHEIAKERAERSAQAAEAESNKSRAAWGKSSDATNSAAARGAAINKQLGSVQGPAERLKLLQDYERAATEYASRAAEAEQRIRESKEAGLRVAQAESQVRQAAIAMQREELGLLKDKQSRINQSVRSIGQMSEMDYQVAAGSLRELQQTGDVNSLPPEMLSQVQQLAPGYAGKLTDIRGDARRAELGIGELEGDPETRQEINHAVEKMNATINVSIELDAQTLANRIDEKLQGYIAAIDAIIDAKTAAAKRSQWANEQLRHATSPR